MNASIKGKQAGKSTRRVVNNATHFTVESGKTVFTAVGGFFSGFFSDPDAPAPKSRAKRATRN